MKRAIESEVFFKVAFLDLLFSPPFVSVRQLHREFLRAGSDVMQTFTFYASDDKLENRGHTQRFSVSERTIFTRT